MPTSQEMKVQNTFDKAMDQINNLQKVFRDEGMLAKAVVDLGGSQDFGAIQEAFDNLYGALEDANYDAMAHIEVESAKQKLGMTKEADSIDMAKKKQLKLPDNFFRNIAMMDDPHAEIKRLLDDPSDQGEVVRNYFTSFQQEYELDPEQDKEEIIDFIVQDFEDTTTESKEKAVKEDKVMKVNKEVDLAGDSIWDKEGENPAKVMVMSITIENPYEPGGYMDDDEDDGYRKVDVEHDGPWSIYTDSGFSKAISEIVGFEVDFTEQGMQDDGMASMEGTMSDKMESVQEGKLTEGYESIKRLQFLAGLKESYVMERPSDFAKMLGTRPPDAIGPRSKAPSRVGEPIEPPRQPKPKKPAIIGPGAGDPVMPGISSADLDGDMPSEPSRPIPGIGPKDLDGDMPADPDTPDMGKDFFGRDKAKLAQKDREFKKYMQRIMNSANNTDDPLEEETNEEKLTEGYESKVLKICKDEGIDCSFKDGKLHLDKEDMAKAKKALKDNEDILELPDMVAESVAEINTDDDAGEEIKEQSPELTRLKQLIGIDPIREMKQ